MNIPGFPERKGSTILNTRRTLAASALSSIIKGGRSHTIVQQGLQVLKTWPIAARKAAILAPVTAPGFFSKSRMTFSVALLPTRSSYLPNAGEYGVGMVFLPPDAERVSDAKPPSTGRVRRGRPITRLARRAGQE